MEKTIFDFPNKNKIRDYLIDKLEDLEYIGDLYNEDGYYYFNTQATLDVKATFENKIYEVVSIEHCGNIGCYIKLKVEENYLNFAAI